MRQVTDTNRIFQHHRMLSGLPTLVLTADCQSWWHSAKWKCNPLLVLILMLTFTNWLQTRGTYIFYTYRAFLNRLMAKQMTALFQSNHINEPLLENNTMRMRTHLSCCSVSLCISARLWLRHFLLLNTEQKNPHCCYKYEQNDWYQNALRNTQIVQTGHIRQATGKHQWWVRSKLWEGTAACIYHGDNNGLDISTSKWIILYLHSHSYSWAIANMHCKYTMKMMLKARMIK